jgi:hypothetical protein
MVLRGNHHRIDVIAREQFAKVAIGRTSFVAVMLVDEVFDLLPPGPRNIADGNHPSDTIV